MQTALAFEEDKTTEAQGFPYTTKSSILFVPVAPKVPEIAVVEAHVTLI